MCITLAMTLVDTKTEVKLRFIVTVSAIKMIMVFPDLIFMLIRDQGWLDE